MLQSGESGWRLPNFGDEPRRPAASLQPAAVSYGAAADYIATHFFPPAGVFRQDIARLEQDRSARLPGSTSAVFAQPANLAPVTPSFGNQVAGAASSAMTATFENGSTFTASVPA